MVAIAASDVSRAGRIAERLQIATAYGDWRSLVAASNIDVVSIAVPPALQPAVVLEAAARGKAIFCEKPLATATSAAEPAVNAARTAGILTAMNFEFAELPTWREAKRLVDSQELGRARSGLLQWHMRTRSRPSSSWKERTEEGGGALGGFASHLVYLADWLLGPVDRVAAWLGPKNGHRQIDSWLDLRGGQRASIRVSTDSATPTGLRAEIQAEAGVIVLEETVDSRGASHTLKVASLGGQLATVGIPSLPASQGDQRISTTALIVHRFVDAVCARTPVHPDIDDGLRIQRVLDAIVAADREGRWIRV